MSVVLQGSGLVSVVLQSSDACCDLELFEMTPVVVLGSDACRDLELSVPQMPVSSPYCRVFL